MLNYRFAMFNRILLVLLLLGSAFRIPLKWEARFVFQGLPAAVQIQSPLPGAAVRGVTPIVVAFEPAEVQAAELFFAYMNHPTKTWFLIGRIEQPSSGVLLEWDTTLITDGIYDLKLVAYMQDGAQQEALAPGIRVRNYSPVETDTPTPILPTATLLPGDVPPPTETATPTITPSPTITLTPTPLPTNPAILSPGQLLDSLGAGSGVVLGLFLILGSYVLARGWQRKRRAGL